MKRILSWVLGAIIVAGIVYAAQTVVNDEDDTFETAWDRQQNMNTEIYSFMAANTIGEEVQAYDANTAKTDVEENITADWQFSEIGIGTAAIDGFPIFAYSSNNLTASVANYQYFFTEFVSPATDSETLSITFQAENSYRGAGDIINAGHTIALYGLANQAGTETATAKLIIGAEGYVDQQNPNGTITDGIGVAANMNNTGGGIITNFTGFYYPNTTADPSGNEYSFYSADPEAKFYHTGDGEFAGDLTVNSISGSYKALNPVVDAAADFAANFTGANLYGGTFICDTAGTIQLPAVTAGMNFTIITKGAIAVVVEPDSSDMMMLDGVDLDDADSATNLSTSGDIIEFRYMSAAGWIATSNGWTDED